MAWVILGFLMLFSGFIEKNDVPKFVGAVMAFGFTSAYLTSYVNSEHKVKRALEVIFTIITFGIIIYGYFVTGSLVLGVIMLFIVGMFFIAFLFSCLLPKIRSRSL